VALLLPRRWEALLYLLAVLVLTDYLEFGCLENYESGIERDSGYSRSKLML